MLVKQKEESKMTPKHPLGSWCDGSPLTEMRNTEGGPVCELKEIHFFLLVLVIAIGHLRKIAYKWLEICILGLKKGSQSWRNTPEIKTKAFQAQKNFISKDMNVSCAVHIDETANNFIYCFDIHMCLIICIRLRIAE